MTATVHQLFQQHAFEPEVLIAMGSAYDRALPLLDSDARREAIARAILGAANAGERSADRLYEIALRAVDGER